MEKAAQAIDAARLRKAVPAVQRARDEEEFAWQYIVKGLDAILAGEVAVPTFERIQKLIDLFRVKDHAVLELLHALYELKRPPSTD